MAESSRVPIPENVREMVRQIMIITEKHSEDDVYAMLQECNMDFNEATQRLLYIDSFQEVKRNKRDRKKVISGRGEVSRSSDQMAMGVLGNYSNRSNGATSTRGRTTILRSDTVPLSIPQSSSPKHSPSPKKVPSPKNSPPPKRAPSPKKDPTPKKAPSSNNSNKHKKELVGESGNASNGQDVHEGGPQKSAGATSTRGRTTILRRDTVPLRIPQSLSLKHSPSPKKVPSPKNSPPPKRAQFPNKYPTPKKAPSSNNSNKHKKELVGESGNASHGQDVHEGGPQKSAGATNTRGRITILRRDIVPLRIPQSSSPNHSPSPKKVPSPTNSPPPKKAPSPKKTPPSNNSNKHKKELIGESGNASNGQDVHEGGPQKSAEEVASKNSTVMIVEGTPEYVMGQTVSTLDLKLEEINVIPLHSVTFPEYIQSIDPFEGGLTFGSMDIDYEKSFASNPNTQAVPRTIPKTEYVSYQGSCLIPQEGEDLVHPESPRHVHEISSLQEVDETVVEYDQQIPDPHFILPIQPTLDGELQSEGHGTQSSQASYTPNDQTDDGEPPLIPHSSYYIYDSPSNTYQFVAATTQRPEQQFTIGNMCPPPSGYGYNATNTQGFQGNDPCYGQNVCPPFPQHGYGSYGYPVQATEAGHHGSYGYPVVQATQAGHPDSYVYPAMQATEAGQQGSYVYPAMQAAQAGHQSSYVYPAMQATQAGDQGSYVYPAMQATQAGQGSYVYPAMQATQAGHQGSYVYPAMQAAQAGHQGSYVYPAMQATQAGQQGSYVYPAMQATEAGHQGSYVYPAMQAAQAGHQGSYVYSAVQATQAGPGSYWGPRGRRGSYWGPRGRRGSPRNPARYEVPEASDGS